MSVLIRKELRQAWRSFRLPAFAITLLFLAIMDPLSTRYMGEILERFAQGVTIIVPPPAPEQAVGTFLGDIIEIGLLVIIAITMGAVASEKASGVTTFVVTKPASRKSYIAAKLLVAAGGVVASIAAGTLVASLYTWTLMGPVPSGRVALAAVSVGLYAELVLAATFAASMVAPSPLTAGGMGLGAFMVAGLAGAIFGRSSIGPYLPSELSANITTLLSGAGGADLLVKPGITALAASAALVAAGFAKFRRQDLQ